MLIRAHRAKRNLIERTRFLELGVCKRCANRHTIQRRRRNESQEEHTVKMEKKCRSYSLPQWKGKRRSEGGEDGDPKLEKKKR